MPVLNELASALGRRDEVPNQELAHDIAERNDHVAVDELIEGLSNKDKRIRSDCIKVLYEIGERKPKLIASYCNVFGGLIDSKHNRLAWGAMSALDSIASTVPQDVFKLLPRIEAAATSGTVITRDRAVGIFTKLGAMKRFADACLPLIIAQLRRCPANQFPMYCEMSLAVATRKNQTALRDAIGARLKSLATDSQKRRVHKVLRQLT